MCPFIACEVDLPVTFIHVCVYPCMCRPLTLWPLIDAIRMSLKVKNRDRFYVITPDRSGSRRHGSCDSLAKLTQICLSEQQQALQVVLSRPIMSFWAKVSTLANCRGRLSGKLGPHSRYLKQIIFIRFPNPCHWFVKLWIIMKLSW